MKTRLPAAPTLPSIPAEAPGESLPSATSFTPLTGQFKQSKSDYGLRHPPPQVLPFRPAVVPPPPDVTTHAAMTPGSLATTPAAGNGHNTAKPSQYSSGSGTPLQPLEAKGDDHPLEACIVAPRLPPPPTSLTGASTR